MKKVLILGGALHQVYIIKKAKEMGLYVITCDYLPDNPGHKYADEYYNVSTTEPELVLALAKKLQVDGVICYGSDVSAKTAAYVCEQMGLPTNPLGAVEILTRKDLFRGYLLEHGFKSPWAITVDGYETIKASYASWNYPVIVKPVDSSGCKGVNKIEDTAMATEVLKDYIEDALRYSREKKVIIESFIEKKGEQISGDIFVVDGKVVFWSFGTEYYSNSDIKEYVPIGEHWPLEHSKSIEAELIRQLQQLFDSLKFKMGECNIEALVDKDDNVYLVEVGPRSGGSLIPQLIEYTTGVNLLEYIIKVALGEDCSSLKQTESEGYWANYNIPSFETGELLEIWIEPEFRKNHVVEYITELECGDRVNRFQNGSDAVGLVIMRFDSDTQMKDCLSNIKDYIEVRVK